MLFIGGPLPTLEQVNFESLASWLESKQGELKLAEAHDLIKQWIYLQCGLSEEQANEQPELLSIHERDGWSEVIWVYPSIHELTLKLGEILRQITGQGKVNT